MTQHFLFLHGFVSSSQGEKSAYLRQHLATRPDVAFDALDFNPTPKDFEYLTVTGMINRLRQVVLDRQLDNLSLIGSSMGGLVALNYAHRFGGVDRLLLLAPALTYISGERTGMPLDEWQQQRVGHLMHYGFGRELPLRYDLEVDGRFYQTAPPPPAPITIIHGRADDVVFIDDSRAYARQYPDRVTLIEIDADHLINDHMALIGQQVDRFLLDL